MDSLGLFLAASRKRSGLTLRDVEAHTGISNAYLSQLENGKIAEPSPTILHKLCTVYKSSYSTALRLAGYPVPGGSDATPQGLHALSRLGPNSDEEAALVEYLQFLRARKAKKIQ